jgi:HAE1 family hydrophobic/amphiphilic exporter-1
MEQMAATTLPPGTGYQWTAMSYQEKLVGSQMFVVFGLALLLVYLVLAGQYESWYAPVSVILAVPLSLIGPVSLLSALKVDNNLYVQIGLVLLIALSAKNAILIVEVARELRLEGKAIIESAVDAARSRFRPILMTSFAFILGVLPLVLATGAGASARKSIGITVFTGMIASTCLAVLFVPSFFVVVQRFEEWLAARKRPAVEGVPAE